MANPRFKTCLPEPDFSLRRLLVKMRVQIRECPRVMEIFISLILLASPTWFSGHHMVFAGKFAFANRLKEPFLVFFW
jgi:hypothetical protein